MSTLRSDSPIQFVKGIGPRRAEWFAAAGINTVSDLLEYFPFRHELDSGEVDIADLEPGTNVTVRGEVVRVGGRWPTLRCEIDDGTGECILRWFDRRFGGQTVYRGAHVIASGRVEIFDERPQIVQPRLQIFDPNSVICAHARGPRQVGVYRGNATLKTNLIRRAVQNILQQAHLPVDEPLPASLLKKRKLLPREEAIRQMHSPTNEAKLQKARERLAYEEFLLMELALALRRRKRLALQTGQKLYVTSEIDRRIRARFPFALTTSQDEVVREISADLESGRPMTRLLQGDVGSGKTVVALYACLAAIANQRQAAIMAPTDILAQQHFTNIDRYLRDSRVRYVLLRGRLGKNQRAEMLAAIERGEIDLIVGTQALIQKDVAFQRLGLVVVDEQHKFGVLQRHEFRTKGPMPHYLVMTATPIPRTLAMTVFGDLDVSIIRQSPPGRGKIITKVVTLAQWETVMGYVRGRLEGGQQAYVVCPLIGEGGAKGSRGRGAKGRRVEDTAGSAGDSADSCGTGVSPVNRGPGVAPAASDAEDLIYDDEDARAGRRSKQAEAASVIATYDKLVSGPWKGLNVGLLHGALPAAEKQATIAAFAAGKLHAVVSTTVVEVGVDVANATIMVVEHADRYGLSQLHQLRGRVGRGEQDSLCVLIAHERTPKAAERLDVMVHTTDGFRIAEADLKQRGPGQLFGTKQHGLPELHVASIIDDFALLEQARQDAFALAAADPQLAQAENKPLWPALRRMFGEKLALIDAA